MYQFSYAEILEDGQETARGGEKQAFDEALQRLENARQKGSQSVEAMQALHFLRRLWMVLIEDLANEGNALPESLRASLISIGLWILKEIDLIRAQKSDNIAGLIDINSIIRDGLK